MLLQQYGIHVCSKLLKQLWGDRGREEGTQFKNGHWIKAVLESGSVRL